MQLAFELEYDRTLKSDPMSDPIGLCLDLSGLSNCKSLHERRICLDKSVWSRDRVVRISW